MTGPWILGLGGNHHNGSACLLKGDRIVAAIQEERLSGHKQCGLRFDRPSLAVQYCLDAAGIAASALDLVVVSPTGWSAEPSANVTGNSLLDTVRNRIPVLSIPHHLGHAVGGFAVSGFDTAVVLVVDGLGSHYCDLTQAERLAVRSGVHDASEAHSIYEAHGCQMQPLAKYLIEYGRWRCFPPPPGQERLVMPIPTPPLDLAPIGTPGMRSFHGLGDMYSAVAEQIFNDRLEGPGKLMGLAAYGDATHPVEDFFAARDGDFTFKDRIPLRFRHNDRYPERLHEYQDLAASTQRAFEHGMLHLAHHAAALSRSRNLVLAGGCALNGLANERLIRESGFDRVFIIPPAEDSGIAIGAAYWGFWQLSGRASRFTMTRDSSGVEYSDAHVVAAASKCPYAEELPVTDPVEACVEQIISGKIVGFFDGGAELGPRALGQRSILCDPRRQDAKEALNSRVKFREPFRPFAPAILKEEVEAWFDTGGFSTDSDFMLRVIPVKADRRREIPAVVHTDGTGRLQTVSESANGRYYQLVRRMFQLTGVPILLNTSLNVKGEPIAETPEDALRCLLFTDIDLCWIDGRLFRRRRTGWTALAMRPVLRARIHYTSSGIETSRGTGWGDLVRHGLADSALERFCSILTSSIAEDVDAGTLAARLSHDLPQYRGWKPEHVLALLCRQRWISLEPPTSVDG